MHIAVINGSIEKTKAILKVLKKDQKGAKMIEDKNLYLTDEKGSDKERKRESKKNPRSFELKRPEE